MSDALKGLKPELVWKYFGEIARIPRCSKSEEKIARYIVETASKVGLEAEQDSFGNVVVRKPASPGRDNVPAIILQGHLDMVCEKNADKTHDFTKDPIQLVRKGDVIMADGTTLGADNGIAVATNLAIMEDHSLEHGPLELLFTVDEETGLTGAANLQPGFLTGRTLLNLDSEEEGEIYVGCAGGKDTTGAWTVGYETIPSGFTAVEIVVRGLKGGHSGLEINAGRGNAIKILNRVLLRLQELGARLSRIEGGNKRNAIPREARAVVYVPNGKKKEADELVSRLNDVLREELPSVDPDLSVTSSAAAKVDGKVVPQALQEKILLTISALPHGVSKMSAEVPGLVETSTNVAVISTVDNKIELATSQRSSVGSEILEIAETVASVFRLGGAESSQGSGYPGWKPNLDSPILEIARRTYEKLYGKQVQIKAVHAGLECGIIGERYPGMDMISFGPTLQAVHSPDEKIFVDTVPKFWEFLLEILKSVK